MFPKRRQSGNGRLFAFVPLRDNIVVCPCSCTKRIQERMSCRMNAHHTSVSARLMDCAHENGSLNEN